MKAQAVEIEEASGHLIRVEDFTVEVTRLPKSLKVSSMELKAMLWNHMENITESSSERQYVYNVHFGMLDYSRMKEMIEIYNLINEQMAEEARLSMCIKDGDRSKHQKAIAAIEKKVE